MASFKPSPCHKCKVHSSICLFICKAYKEWRAEAVEHYREEAKERHVQTELFGQMIEGKNRYNRKRKYRR